MTYQSTNQIYAFFHVWRPVGQIRQISYICLLEKNFGKPQLNPGRVYNFGYGRCQYIISDSYDCNHTMTWDVLKMNSCRRPFVSGHRTVNSCAGQWYWFTNEDILELPSAFIGTCSWSQLSQETFCVGVNSIVAIHWKWHSIGLSLGDCN